MNFLPTFLSTFSAVRGPCTLPIRSSRQMHTDPLRAAPWGDENIKVVAAKLVGHSNSSPMEETPKSLLVGESGCRLPDHARRTFGRASDVALLHGFRDRNPARSISASASAHGCRVARSANWDSHRVGSYQPHSPTSKARGGLRTKTNGLIAKKATCQSQVFNWPGRGSRRAGTAISRRNRLGGSLALP